MFRLSNFLRNAIQDLSSQRPSRIAVYSVDKWSGAQDLITALLHDPLASDHSRNDIIRSRWKYHAPNLPLTISTSVSSTLNVSSPYLFQFPAQLQITEIPPTSHNETIAHTLLQADAAVVICNPLTTSLPDLIRTGLLSNNPNMILILSCTSSSTVVDPPSAFLSRFLPQEYLSGSPFDGVTILTMDPPRALAAIEALRADSRSPTAVQRYQDDFVGSRVSTLTAALKSKFSSGSDRIRVQTALAQFRFALATCTDTLGDTKRELEKIRAAVGHLNDRISEAKIRVQGDVLGREKDSEVIAALDNARKEIRVVMDCLSWFKMVSRVDEISHIVGQAVEKAWCQELEKTLIIHTGRLSVLQNTFTKDTFALLESQHTPPFNSAVLSNTLHQITASPYHTLTPHILTAPVHARRTQIIKYPTIQLHVSGQRAVFGMGSSVVVGASVGWAGWMGWLASTGEGMLGMVGMDPPTTIAMGLLSVVAGVRWAVGSWEKAKRRWWEDWERIGQGLNRDLRANLDRVVRENVVVVAESGCERLLELLVKRREELDKDEGELEVLQADLKRLEQRNPK